MQHLTGKLLQTESAKSFYQFTQSTYVWKENYTDIWISRSLRKYGNANSWDSKAFSSMIYLFIIIFLH